MTNGERRKPMSRRTAKAEARRVVAVLIDSYLDTGQPDSDCFHDVGGWTSTDADVLREAFLALRREIARRPDPRRPR